MLDKIREQLDKVEAKLRELKEEKTEAKRWTRKYINDLPDAAFAYIEPGGKKDEEGKTVPRRLRHLPHHNHKVKNPNENSTVDIPHLRNALARVVQKKTRLSPKARAKAKAHLVRHARALLPNSKFVKEKTKAALLDIRKTGTVETVELIAGADGAEYLMSFEVYRDAQGALRGVVFHQDAFNVESLRDLVEYLGVLLRE
ncbi:MAG: hypothetical protein DRP85_00735 [Candidatus Makaraimicrobium thalassicum]|nr:MAG: hypothetical protein DRP85_00735 [Candidatus Omnitrophota bacterium]